MLACVEHATHRGLVRSPAPRWLKPAARCSVGSFFGNYGHADLKSKIECPCGVLRSETEPHDGPVQLSRATERNVKAYEPGVA